MPEAFLLASNDNHHTNDFTKGDHMKGTLLLVIIFGLLGIKERRAGQIVRVVELLPLT